MATTLYLFFIFSFHGDSTCSTSEFRESKGKGREEGIREMDGRECGIGGQVLSPVLSIVIGYLESVGGLKVERVTSDEHAYMGSSSQCVERGKRDGV
ncbi:hypothetical protein IE53DRAFT_391273 [Violaceomyces palustris]|uniref:Uncharacterized protein n=1 Tax=Violaceomyces palustris TaxID=1673888 RepID=A0ACD0NL64_9BASI|nr:hypothetical protein IE53DRAFT_391273 [Violaceomyces palustris]